MVVDVPQQPNGVDCGLNSLLNMRRIITSNLRHDSALGVDDETSGVEAVERLREEILAELYSHAVERDPELGLILDDVSIAVDCARVEVDCARAKDSDR